MIRNVVLGRIRDDGDEDRVAQGLAGIASLRLPGLLAMQIGRDLGLRENGWTFAITNDWADADSYRAYDLDPEHNRYRAMVAGECSDVARVQFELADPSR